jgi:hypothetical protein
MEISSSSSEMVVSALTEIRGPIDDLVQELGESDREAGRAVALYDETSIRDMGLVVWRVKIWSKGKSSFS